MGQEKGSLIKQKQRLSAEAKENKRFVVYIPAGNTQTLPGKEGFTMHSGCSASSTDNSCHPSVTEEIQMSSVPLQPDGTRVHCTPVPTKAFYLCGSDVPGNQIHMVQ